MSKELMIFGAGDLAREVVGLVQDINKSGSSWNLSGFVAERSSDKEQLLGLPVYHGLRDLHREGYSGAAVISVGTPEVSYKIRQRIDQSPVDLSFPPIIHPSVIGANRADFSRGVVVCAGAILTHNIQLKEFTLVNIGCTIAHDLVAGPHTVINPQVNISGRVTLSEYSYLGAGASLRDDITVGRGAQVAIGSVVHESVPQWTVVGGNPARVIKDRSPWTD